MTRKLKSISLLLIGLACARLVLSAFMWHFPDVLLQLAIPHVILVIGVSLVRTDRMGRWAVGTSGLLAVVTFVSVYEAPREFWTYLSLWITSIVACQTIVAVLFSFESFRQFLHCRRNPRTLAEPNAPPNGGLATPVANSGATEGPPSVS